MDFQIISGGQSGELYPQEIELLKHLKIRHAHQAVQLLSHAVAMANQKLELMLDRFPELEANINQPPNMKNHEIVFCKIRNGRDSTLALIDKILLNPGILDGYDNADKSS